MEKYLILWSAHFLALKKSWRLAIMAILSIICGEIFFGKHMHNLLKNIVFSIPPEINPYFQPIMGTLMAGAIIHLLYKNMEKYIQLLNSAIRDPLTGLYNSRFFEEMMPRIISKAKRYNQSVCMCVIDIDDFKKINDTFGHSAGDEALILVAHTLQKTVLRPDDLLIRKSGGADEFIVVWAADDIKRADHLLKRINEKLTNLPFMHKREVVYLNSSIGFSCLSAKMNDVEKKIKKIADDTMYECKRRKFGE